MDPSDATALAAEFASRPPHQRYGSPRISPMSPALRCEDRDPGLRLRTTPSTPHLRNTCLMPSHSTTHPCRQKHSMPGCGLVIGRFTTIPSAEFSIAHSTTHRGPKLPRLRDRVRRAKSANLIRSLRSRRNSGAPATRRVPGREYRAHPGPLPFTTIGSPARRDATRGG